MKLARLALVVLVSLMTLPQALVVHPKGPVLSHPGPISTRQSFDDCTEHVVCEYTGTVTRTCCQGFIQTCLQQCDQTCGSTCLLEL